MKIVVLKEGDYAVNKNKEFISVEDVTKVSGVKIAVQPFLIITANDFILLDTGLAITHNGEPIIYQCLKKENILPEQISKVLISHLHKDHIGGIGYFENKSFTGNFPNAKVYIQQRELDFALTQQDSLSYDFEIVEKLTALPNLVMLNDDKGKISDEIVYKVSSGHTPFHQEFWITEKGEKVFYGADNLPTSSYLKYDIAYKTDYDGKRAMGERIIWKKQAKIEDWRILFYHDLVEPLVHYQID